MGIKDYLPTPTRERYLAEEDSGRAGEPGRDGAAVATASPAHARGISEEGTTTMDTVRRTPLTRVPRWRRGGSTASPLQKSLDHALEKAKPLGRAGRVRDRVVEPVWEGSLAMVARRGRALEFRASFTNWRPLPHRPFEPQLVEAVD